MFPKQQNFAYIDGANLHKGIGGLGWQLDYKRFRVWLAEKYGIQVAYVFIGLIPRYKGLYKYLQESGFTLVFKEVVYDGNGKPKGNCDADLVLQATRDAYENKFDAALWFPAMETMQAWLHFCSNGKSFLLFCRPTLKRSAPYY